MSDTEIILYYRMFWTLVGFPILLACNVGIAWAVWRAVGDE